MIYFISPQTRLFGDTEAVQASSIEQFKVWADAKLRIAREANTHCYIELDSETSGFFPQLGDRLKCIQFGDYNDQWVIDVTHDPTNLHLFVVQVLENNEITFLLANAKFDLRFFIGCGVNIKSVYDVFLVECLLTAGLRDTPEQREKHGLGLDFMAMKYLNVTLDKSIRGNIHREGLTDRVIKYAADDVKYLGKIREHQLLKIQEWKIEELVKLENQVVRVFALMEWNGIYLDEDRWKAVADITAANTIKLEKQLDDIVSTEPKLAHLIPKYVQSNLFGIGDPVARPAITWTSPKQKLDVLNNILPTPVASTDDKTLQKLKKEHPIVPVLVEHAKQSKLKSSFGHDFLKHRDKASGRIYPDYWQVLSSGRISASNPNVNQIPSKGELAKAIRAAFTARSGRKIVGGDYSGRSKNWCDYRGLDNCLVSL